MTNNEEINFADMPPMMRHRARLALLKKQQEQNAEGDQSESAQESTFSDLQLEADLGRLKTFNSREKKKLTKISLLNGGYLQNLQNALANDSDPTDADRYALVWLLDCAEKMGLWDLASELAGQAFNSDWETPDAFEYGYDVLFARSVTENARAHLEEKEPWPPLGIVIALVESGEYDLPDQITQDLYRYSAEAFENQGNLEAAKDCYHICDQLGRSQKQNIQRVEKKLAAQLNSHQPKEEA